MARTAKKKSAARKTSRAQRPRGGPETEARQGAAADAPPRPSAATAASAAGYRARIRMYRQGLGDCFLVSLPRNDGSGRPFYLMIDCGVVLGTADPGTIMTKVMEDIVETTGGKIDVLVATHEHWDHLSGFIQAKASFDKLQIGQLWLAWTEDPNDDLTKTLKAEKGRALAALHMGLTHLQLVGDGEATDQLGSILEFFGATGGSTTGDALKNVRAKVGQPRYFDPKKDDPVVLAGIDARFYVLGPPHDETWLRKINPSAKDKETYGLVSGLQMFLDGTASAFAETDEGRPFDRQYEIPFSVAQAAPGLEFFRKYYWQPQADAPEAWRRIDGDWMDGLSEMALQLDSLTNNTSLVLAIELEPGGDVLLFAADAQVGNWLSWQELSWQVNGATVKAADLLNRTIFYKVGHHGSHNATLRAKGLEEMKSLRAAMIPVNHDMAEKKHWGKMPLDELVAALKQQAKGVVLRVDDPAMPASHENVAEGADRLFYEITF